MPGRYEFSMPEAPARDGWFRVGTLDVTTTVIYTVLAAASLFVYAISPSLALKGAFSATFVRDGQIWRLATYPLVNPPDGSSLAFLWIVISLVFFWWLGHRIEEAVGRKPYTVLLLAMTIIPAVIVTLINITNDVSAFDLRWVAFSLGLTCLSLALLVVFALEHPQLPAMFGLPLWVFAAAYVAIDVLQLTGDRRWSQLILDMLVIVVAVIGARQLGMLAEYAFIPRFLNIATPSRSPYGELRSNPPRVKKGKRGKGKNRGAGGNTVVAGPWADTSGPTPLEQAELDVLLDKISAGGIDSLTKQEKDRLNALSKRMRGS